jgi:predicted metal-binding protein
MDSSTDYKSVIESFVRDYPVCDYLILTPPDLVFSDRVRTICERDCPNYGKSWACPPAIDSVGGCIAVCRAYGHVFLFTSVAEVPDIMDIKACLEARRDHEQLTRALRGRFKEHFGKVLTLSTGCMLCGECACPGAPCRYPEERVSAVESHGILIMETASRLGVALDLGHQTVTYAGLIFFDA